MKSVAALGQDLHSFSFLEHADAYGALHFQAAAIVGGPVQKYW